MLMVVLGHATCLWSKSGWFNQAPSEKSVVLTIISEWVGTFHIYAFVLISGFIFSYICYEDKRYGDFFKFVSNKVKRLLVPYLFVLVVWVMPTYIFWYKPQDIKLLVNKFMLGESPAQLWFLLMLFWVFIIAFLLKKTVYCHPFRGGIMALLLYLLGALASRVFPNYFQIWTALEYFLLFYIGMVIKQYDYFLLNKVFSGLFIALDIGLFVCHFLLLDQDLAVYKVLDMGITFLLHVLGAITVFLVINRIVLSNSRLYKNKCYLFFKRHYFTIYLFHQQVMYLVINLLNGKVPPFILAFANFVIAIAISIFISALLNKCRITRILLGQKC